MFRPLALLIVFVLLVAACDGEAEPPVSPSRSPATPSPTTPTTAMTPSSSTEPSASGSPTPSPTPPGSILVETDAEVGDLDTRELAPQGNDVTGRWYGVVGGLDVLVLAVAGEGDAFSRDRALWRWIARPDLGGWLGVEMAGFPAGRGVLSIDVAVADVTDDGDDDALVFALTGGSGACGSWSVLDLATAQRVFDRDLCDGSIDAWIDPVGLFVTESIYRQGDPHCCPTARRETVLTYRGDARWAVDRRQTVELG